MADSSILVRTPIWRSMAAWASEPWMSWRQRRQSKEMDSVNWATSAPGPLEKRPLRETGAALADGFVVLILVPLDGRTGDFGMGIGFGIIGGNSILIVRDGRKLQDSNAKIQRKFDVQAS